MRSPASTPLAHANGAATSPTSLSYKADAINAMHRHVPAQGPEREREPNPEPDTAWCNRHGAIAPDDWNALFYAVQMRLENCVSDQPIPGQQLRLHDPLLLVRATVLDCVAALRQLQATLNHERQRRPGL